MTDAFAAINRHEVPATTPDYIIIDHQLQHATIEASGLTNTCGRHGTSRQTFACTSRLCTG